MSGNLHASTAGEDVKLTIALETEIPYAYELPSEIRRRLRDEKGAIADKQKADYLLIEVSDSQRHQRDDDTFLAILRVNETSFIWL